MRAGACFGVAVFAVIPVVHLGFLPQIGQVAHHVHFVETLAEPQYAPTLPCRLVTSVVTSAMSRLIIPIVFVVVMIAERLAGMRRATAR